MAAKLPTCESLLLRRDDSRLYVTLNRPETRNALGGDMVGELLAVIDAIEDDRSIRTVILRGADGTFCAGGDIRGFRASFEAPKPAGAEKDPIAINNRRFGDFLIRWNRLPQTVVAVIEGAAFGGGLGLACVNDVAIAKADTRFALSETGLGIPPAQIAPFVVQRLGLTTARRLMLTGARFDGRHAHQVGLVHFVCDDDAALDATLTEVLNGIGRCAPGANAATKDILHSLGEMPLTDVLDRAADHFADQMRGPEGREGVAAFLEKRRAAWVEKLD